MRTIIVMLVLLFTSSLAFAELKTLTIKIATEDVLLDGTPDNFNLSMFVKKLQQEATEVFSAKGYEPSDNGKYRLNIKLESMGHKFHMFQFSSKYVAQYRYEFKDADKIVARGRGESKDRDLVDLVREMSDDLYTSILQPLP